METVEDLKKLFKKISKEKSDKEEKLREIKKIEDENLLIYIEKEAKKDVPNVMISVKEQITKGCKDTELSYYNSKFETTREFWDILKKEVINNIKFSEVKISSIFNKNNGGDDWADDKWHYNLNIKL